MCVCVCVWVRETMPKTFLICSINLLFVSVPVFCFPKQINWIAMAVLYDNRICVCFVPHLIHSGPCNGNSFRWFRWYLRNFHRITLFHPRVLKICRYFHGRFKPWNVCGCFDWIFSARVIWSYIPAHGSGWNDYTWGKIRGSTNWNLEYWIRAWSMTTECHIFWCKTARYTYNSQNIIQTWILSLGWDPGCYYYIPSGHGIISEDKWGCISIDLSSSRTWAIYLKKWPIFQLQCCW